MEPKFRDLAALDHRLQDWRQMTEVEQGALLMDLATSLRTRLQFLELDRQVPGLCPRSPASWSSPSR